MRHAVILAGGGGTRLWPASRRERPKQLLALGPRPDESLLAATWRRIEPLIPTSRMMAVTASGQAAAIAGDMPADATVLTEPIGRNTAAALGLAAVHLCESDPDAVIAALPADHVIVNEAAFRDVADRALTCAEQSHTFALIGIRPTRPETGYGYVQVGQRVSATGALEVLRFVEKPRLAEAQTFVAGTDHLWNAGMLFVRADVLLRAIERLMPATHAALVDIRDAIRAGDPGRIADAMARVYPGLPSISIDHGVLEKLAGDVAVIRADFGWTDLGSWSSLADVRAPDADGNIVSGVAVLQDARGNIVVGEDDCAIALIGVDDLVVVKSGDAILVVPRARAQEVRDAVELLKRHHLERFS